MNGNNKIWYGVGIDTSGLEKGMREAKNMFKDAANDSVIAGARIGKIWDPAIRNSDDFIEVIATQKRAIRELEATARKAQKEFDKMAPGAAKNAAGQGLASAKEDLKAEKKALDDLEISYREYKKTQGTILTQMRQVREEMAKLVMSGGQESEQYRALEEKLKSLALSYREVQAGQKALVAGSPQLAGAISGIQGLIGAYAVGQGALSMFVTDNEKLMQVQAKLQAVMSVMMGMQQVSNTLHQTSAFRITTVRTVTNLWTAAQNRLTIALGGSAVAAKVLMGVLTLGVSAAVMGAIALINKLSKSNKEAKERADELNKSISNSAASTLVQFEKMSREWDKLGNSLKDKKKYISENSDAFKKLGVDISSVNDADRLFIDQKDAFVESVMARARATAAMEIATEKYREALTLMLERDAMPETISVVTVGVNGAPAASREVPNWKRAKATEDYEKKMAEFRSLAKMSADEQEDSINIMAEAGIKTLKESGKKAIDSQSALIKAILDADKELQQSRLSILKDGRIKALAEEDLRYRQLLAKIEEEKRGREAAYKKEGKGSYMNAVGKIMTDEFGTGNVNLLARPLIDAAKLVEKGWEDAGEGIATVFSSQMGVEDAEGRVVEILVTPILPDGTVLSPEELDDYVYNQLQGAENLLSADKKGIVISVDVDPSGSAGERLHNLQEQYYDLQNSVKDTELTDFDVAFFDERITNAAIAYNRNRAEINERYNKEIEDASNRLTDALLSDEERKQAGIKRTYDELRKQAKKWFEGGGFGEGEEGEAKYNAFLGQLDAAETHERQNAALEGFRSFKQEYLRLYADFQKKRKEAEEQGADVAGLANADAVFEKSIKDLATKFAENNPEFAAWAEGIKQIAEGALDDGATTVIEAATKQIEEILASAKLYLASIEEGGVDAGEAEAYGQALARIMALEKELESLRGKKSTQKTDSDWKKLYSTLQKVANEFDEIGDAIGGTAGEAVKLSGTIASSTLQGISAITHLANWSVVSTQMAAEGASKAIIAVEKASVILAVVSAAMQVIQQVVKFLDSSAKKNERLQQEVEYYNRLVDVYDRLIDKQKELTQSLSGKDVTDAHKEGLKLIEAQIKASQQSLKSHFAAGASAGSHSYGYRYDRDFGKILSQEKLLSMTAEEWNELIRENAELWARLPEEVRNYAQSVIDAGESTKELANAAKEALTGLSFDELSDSLDDLVRQTDLAFGDIEESFSDHMSNAILKTIKNKYLNSELEKWYASFEEAMKDGTLSDEEADALRRWYQEIIENGNKAYNAALNVAGVEMPDESSRTASAKGFAQASQDSIDKLEGIFTNIQGHTYNIQGHTFNISEHLKIMNANAAVMNDNLAAIRHNTNRLEAIDANLHRLSVTVDDIRLNGISLSK